MDQYVQRIPLLLERVETSGDAVVARDIHLEHQVRAEVAGHAGHAILETILIAECEFSAFAAHGARDAVSNRTLGREAHDQGALSCQKSHG